MRRSAFSGAALIAGVLDAFAGDAGASRGRISELLTSGSARNLSQAFDQLNPSERNALRARWGRSLEELISLSNERDAWVFHHGLLQVGRRLEDNDQVDLAGVVYSGLVAEGSNSPHPPLILRGGEERREGGEKVPPLKLRGGQEGLLPSDVANQAQRRLNAINGVGDWRERFAFSLQRIPNQATRWDVLLAMTGAGFTFRGFRLLTTASWAGSFESVLALNAASASTAFLAETIAFTSLGKVAGALAGHPQDTSANGIFNEWAGGAAMLLGLKGMGALTGAGVRSIYGEASAVGARHAVPLRRFTEIFAPQAGMFMGILVGNRLAELGGFHPERHGDTWLVDGVTTLIEFNVAGNLQRRAGGPALVHLEARMEAMTRNIGHGSGRPGEIWDGRSKDRPLPGVLEWMSEIFRPELVTPEGLPLPPFENRPSKIENSTTVFSLGGSAIDRATDLLPSAPPNAPPPPAYRISYPPEIDSWLRDFETRAREPFFSFSSRLEVISTPRDMEGLDRLWFFQHRELFARFPYIKVTERSDDALLEPFPGQNPPAPNILNRARELLSEDGTPGPLARRVLEIEIPFQAMDGAFQDKTTGLGSRAGERALTILSVLQEATLNLKNNVILANDSDSLLVFRIPSLSLYEKILQAMHSNEPVVFRTVEGRRPQDEVMGLRSRKTPPAGISRDWVWLEDVHDWVPPSIFTLHDAIFHGSVDAAASLENYALSQKIYDWAERRLPEGETREYIRKSLSDGKLASPLFFSKALLSAIQGQFGNILSDVLRDPNLHHRSLVLEDMRHLLEGLSDMTGIYADPSAPPGFFGQTQGLDPLTRRAWRDLHETCVGECDRMREWQGVSQIIYPAKPQEHWNRISAQFADPNYFKGTREELLARRPSFADVDPFWFFQVEDYARRIPYVTVTELDARVLLKPIRNDPGASAPVDVDLISRVLARLEREQAGNPHARRVLDLNYERYSETLDALNNLPQLRWVATPPFWSEAEMHLNHRVQFGDAEGNQAKIRFVSPSLFEILLQEANPDSPVHLFFVPGLIPRPLSAQLRGKRLPPMGLADQAFEFPELGGIIHPLPFAQHDKLEHASRDATTPQVFSDWAEWIYPRFENSLPISRLREEYLDDLSALPFGTNTPLSVVEFSRLLFKPLEAHILRNHHAASLPHTTENLRQLEELFTALSRTIEREFSKHPQLSEHQAIFLGRIAELRRANSKAPSGIR